MNSNRGLALTLYGFLGFEGLTENGAAWAPAILVGAFVGSIAVVTILLVRLPATYFLGGDPRGGWGGPAPGTPLGRLGREKPHQGLAGRRGDPDARAPRPGRIDQPDRRHVAGL